MRYAIKNNNFEKVDELMPLFIQDSNVDKQIHTLQYIWYEVEMGKAYLRVNEWGKAMRQFKYI